MFDSFFADCMPSIIHLRPDELRLVRAILNTHIPAREVRAFGSRVLAQRGLDVRLGWSRAMHEKKFSGRQPESLTRDDWESSIGPWIAR